MHPKPIRSFARGLAVLSALNRPGPKEKGAKPGALTEAPLG